MAAREGPARRRTTVDDPVDHNLRTLTGLERPDLAPSQTALEREIGLRFVLRARGRPSATRVRAAILTDHGLATRVRLFPRPAGPAAVTDERRFTVILPGLARRDIPQNPFDLARQLEETDGLDVVLVEPDLPSALTTGNTGASTTAALGGIPGCEVDAEPRLPVTWHLDTMNVLAAWALNPPSGRRFGEGIVVGHPDTGWVEHDELDAGSLDLTRARDFVDGDRNAKDPLERGLLGIGFLANPGHGLSTGSVLVSGHAVGQVKGVAPQATLVPLRAAKRVWQVLSGEIARAVDHAVAEGCHVISISLGGFALFHLEEALNDAVAQDVIVCAAAGNCVQVVPFPAAYPNCVAVAASDHDDRPWRGTSRGGAVDIAAPGANVWVARRRRGERELTRLGQMQGASPATAATAGVAALWLAYHGRDALRIRYQGQVRLQHVLLHLLRQTARVPVGWDTGRFGAGIVDAAALLQAPLPDADDVPRDVRARASLAVTEPVEVIARTTGLSETETRRRLAGFLRRPAGAALDAPRLDADLIRHGQELAFLLATDRAAYGEFVAPPAATGAVLAAGTEASPPTSALARVASAGLRARLVGP